MTDANAEMEISQDELDNLTKGEEVEETEDKPDPAIDGEEEQEPEGDEEEEVVEEDDEPEEKPKPVKQTEPEPEPEPEGVKHETEDAIVQTYDAKIANAQAFVSLLKQFMDGKRDVKAADGSTWPAYEDMTPSQRRDVDKQLTRYEDSITTLSREKEGKISTARVNQVTSDIRNALNAVGKLNPAFKNMDEGTAERIEARYLRLKLSGRMGTMTDDEICKTLTNGITPVQAAKGKAKGASARRPNAVRPSDSTFRVKAEPKATETKATEKYRLRS